MNNFRRQNEEIASSACLKPAASPSQNTTCRYAVRDAVLYAVVERAGANSDLNRQQTTEKYTANVVSRDQTDNKCRIKTRQMFPKSAKTTTNAGKVARTIIRLVYWPIYPRKIKQSIGIRILIFINIFREYFNNSLRILRN